MNMKSIRLRLIPLLCAACGVWLLAGCGGSGAASGDGNATAENATASKLPTLAIPAKGNAVDPDDAEDDEDADEMDDDKAPLEIPKAGTPERLVHDATKLLLEPPPATEDIAALKKHRKEKNEKVVKLSQQAIQLTHKDPEKERLFNLAVHNLLEARTQLALSGETESIDLLNEDAAALFKRDPKSAAALESAYAQVNLAYGLAKAAPADELQWLHEFARSAKHFAVNFPGEERRSLPLLFAAGLSCELAHETKEAVACYTLIRKDFPNSTFAARVAPILKRIKLVGNPPRIAGPTLGGEPFAIDDLLGKVVLVVFWSSETEPFQEQLPQLLKIVRKQSKRGLEVVGINLDQDDSVVRKFTLEHKIAWPQIFYTEAEKRGWAHPIVTHYGVMDIPAYWLIDRSGNTASTTVKLTALSADIDKLLADGEKPEN
ncbi:MAG: TlpA family protein disulfide reductase [Planctomycetia bacterium]|nr:TlpA family protein disulfide reductase [Planctomycetia bacterium]